MLSERFRTLPEVPQQVASWGRMQPPPPPGWLRAPDHPATLPHHWSPLRWAGTLGRPEKVPSPPRKESRVTNAQPGELRP